MQKHEFHVLHSCPRYAKERSEWLRDLSPETKSVVHQNTASMDLHYILFRGRHKADWENLAKFLTRISQSRRKMRAEFQNRTAKLDKCSFIVKKAAWRMHGKHVCRHGVFFQIEGAFTFPCSEAEYNRSDARWLLARHEAAIDEDLRAIVTRPFATSGRLSRPSLRRLQNRLRAQDEGLPMHF